MFFQFFIVRFDVTHTGIRKFLIAVIHFRNRPVQCPCRLFRIGNDRDQQMGYAIVNTKFNDLWIDHDKLDLVRSCLI